MPETPSALGLASLPILIGGGGPGAILGAGLASGSGRSRVSPAPALGPRFGGAGLGRVRGAVPLGLRRAGTAGAQQGDGQPREPALRPILGPMMENTS